MWPILRPGRASRLAVEMQPPRLLGRQLAPALDVGADQIGHHSVAVASVAPSGQPAMARMWFSNWLTSAGVDGPVAGIVHPRRDLVDEKARAVFALEHLHAQARRHSRAPRRPCRAIRRASSAQSAWMRAGTRLDGEDAVLVHVLDRIVEFERRRPAPRTTRTEISRSKATRRFDEGGLRRAALSEPPRLPPRCATSACPLPS